MAGVQSIRVFVCDDSYAMLRLVELQLAEDERFEVVGQAHMPASCVAEVARSAPDLILLDHGVPPQPDWEEFLGALRGAAPAARIVLFSGLPERVLAREAQDRGLDGYLEKGHPAAELRE